MSDSAIASLGACCSQMAGLIRRYGQCPIGVLQREPFDVLAAAIMGQQLSSSAADAIRRKVQRELRIERPFQAAHFARRRACTLRHCGLSAGKARYIQSLARLVIARQLDLSRLAKLADEDVIALLTKQPGIGIWTAQMFLIFGLGRLDVMSSGDAGLRRAVVRLFSLEHASEEVMIEVFDRWRPYRSIAAWYLWQYIDDPASR